MVARHIKNLDDMAQIWAINVTELNGEMEQFLALGLPVPSRLRARIRQAALSLATIREQLERLHGIAYSSRDEAFERYKRAVRALAFVHSGSETLIKAGKKAIRVEQAERTADTALLQWCGAYGVASNPATRCTGDTLRVDKNAPVILILGAGLPG